MIRTAPNFRNVLLALALSCTTLAASRAEATTYTAYTGQFQHYSNVATVGGLLGGTIDVVGDLMSFVLSYSVVTNNVHQGQIRVQGQFAQVTNQTDANGIELPVAFNPILQGVQVMFTGGVHSGRRYVNFSAPNINFTRLGNDLRFTVGFNGVNISDHPRGPLSFSAALHGIPHEIPTTPNPPVHPVPEPLTGALVAIGLVTVGLRSRRVSAA